MTPCKFYKQVCHLLFSSSSFLTRLHNFLNDVFADAERAEIQFRSKSDNHYHYLIILSEDSSPGGLSLHLRQSRAHHRSQPWQDIHCPSVVHFPEQLSRLIIGWTMATCLTVYFVDKIFVYPLDDHYRQPPRGGRSVLKIHFFIESGLKMIQLKIKSQIFIQKNFSFNRAENIQ